MACFSVLRFFLAKDHNLWYWPAISFGVLVWLGIEEMIGAQTACTQYAREVRKWRILVCGLPSWCRLMVDFGAVYCMIGRWVKDSFVGCLGAVRYVGMMMHVLENNRWRGRQFVWFLRIIHLLCSWSSGSSSSCQLLVPCLVQLGLLAVSASTLLVRRRRRGHSRCRAYSCLRRLKLFKILSRSISSVW